MQQSTKLTVLHKTFNRKYDQVSEQRKLSFSPRGINYEITTDFVLT